MEKKILETCVISTRYILQLESDMNRLLKVGYELHNAMIITPFKSGNSEEFLYTQIMAKYKEE